MDARHIKTNNIKHNIDIQILSIYKNYVSVVYNYVVTTYIGDEYMDDDIKENHFNYCWEKASTDFHITGLRFDKMILARDYFKKLVFRMFYSSNLKNINDGKSCHAMFFETIKVLFEFKPTYSDQVNVLNNIYKIFNTYE